MSAQARVLITNKFLLKNQECSFRKFISNLGLGVTELQTGVESFQVEIGYTLSGTINYFWENYCKKGGG